MKTSIISQKISNGGCLIEPSHEGSIFELNKENLVNIFEEKGLIVFRNFNLDKKK